jgi:flagellar assembly protein FliH
MEMILRAPKLSDERRRLPAAPAHSREPAADASGPDRQALAPDVAAAPQELAEALDGPLLDQLARLHAEREARDSAELLALEESEREQERESERQRVLEEELAVRDKARKRAYDDGLEQGRTEGLMEMQATVADLRTIFASVEAARETWLADREDGLVAIAYEAVCRICGPILATPHGVREQVKLTLKLVRDRETVTVRLAAADVEKLKELAAGGTALWEGRRTELVADASLDAGGCVIETANGTLDAQLRRQFEQLLEVLIAARRSGQAAA